MPIVALLNQSGTKIGEIQLADSVFGIEPNDYVQFEEVLRLRASLRQGTHKTKTRGEVSGGGKKPWAQKGTGHARQGSTRAPHWRGGGKVFGPVPRDYAFKLNRKVRKLAVKSALSQKVLENGLVVVDKLNLEAPKTKDMVAVLDNLKAEGKVLVVTADENLNVLLSSRNLPGVLTITATNVNVYDLLNSNKCVFTQDAVKKIEEVLA